MPRTIFKTDQNPMMTLISNLLYLTLYLTILFDVSESTMCMLNGVLSGTTLSKSHLSGCRRDVTSLDAGRNSFTTIDVDAFDGFYALESINLNDNQITDLPVGLFDRPFKSSLLDISATNNKIQSLNNFIFMNNFNLKVINLAYNDITFIDTNVFHEDLTKLEVVNISHNGMTYFEPWPYVPKTPQGDKIDLEFDLSYNRINRFTNSMNWTYDLQEPYEYLVYLQFNEMANFSNDFIFQYFNSSEKQNILTEVLTFGVNITNNPYFCSCMVYPLAKNLHDSFFLYYRIEEWRYRCASPDHLYGIDFLHDINLDALICNITNHCPTNCTCQEQPYISALVINCTNAKLSALPATIPSYSNNIEFVSLYLDGNYIQAIGKTNYSNKIKNLTVANNFVKYVDGDAIKEMTELENIDLSGNSLKTLPKEIQKLSIDNVKIDSNPLECDCDMTWMAVWVSLSSTGQGSSLTCTFEGDARIIKDVTEDNLNCNIENFIIIFSVIMGVVVALIVAGIITAKRCPYETKVLIYKLFRIHPRDRYKVDQRETMEYDAYLSFDNEDIQVRQWIKTIFMKKLEENGKKRYRFYCPLRDADVGEDYGDTLVKKMTKSRRIFILLSPGYFTDQWRIYESDQAEMEHNGSEKTHPRVVYIIWYDQNTEIKKYMAEEPWKSRLVGKKVLSPDEKFFWSKVRYELPIKPKSKKSRVDNSYTNIQDVVRRQEELNCTPIPTVSKPHFFQPEKAFAANSCSDLHIETLFA